jgi:hypothetical protein
VKLIERLLAKNLRKPGGCRRVLARVLLDDAGRVQAVRLKRSCGDPAIDERDLAELQNGRYPANRLESNTSRRWRDVD